MTEKLQQKYQQAKADFLDSLQPDDFRNGASFNSAEEIIDQLFQALLQHAKNLDNHEEFITKALSHLFRENSQAKVKALTLAQLYLQKENPNLTP